MTVHRVYVTTDARARRRQLLEDVWTAVRVAASAAAVLVAAPLEMAAALLGLPPVAWTARHIADRIRADWKRRRSGRASGPAGDPDGPAPTQQDAPELSGVVIDPTEFARKAEEAPRG